MCPWKVLAGRSWPSLHTWMHMSVLQEAKVLLLCQSTSRAGAVGGGEGEGEKRPAAEAALGLSARTSGGGGVSPEWNGNCCLASPVWASQIMVVCGQKRILICLGG